MVEISLSTVPVNEVTPSASPSPTVRSYEVSMPNASGNATVPSVYLQSMLETPRKVSDSPSQVNSDSTAIAWSSP